MTDRGLFVVFEGGDGVGKSTQAGLLGERLAAAGHEVVRTRQPGGTPVGAAVRALLLDPGTGDLAPRAEALLYAADKADHVHQVVRPALARGAVVVCDRYVDSMLAYQGAGRSLDLEEVERLARWATGDLRPDLTVLLDDDPAEVLLRLTEPDRLESAGADVHQRARDHFLALAAREPQRYLVLTAGADRESLADRIWARVGQALEPSVPGDTMSS